MMIARAGGAFILLAVLAVLLIVFPSAASAATLEELEARIIELTSVVGRMQTLLADLLASPPRINTPLPATEVPNPTFDFMGRTRAAPTLDRIPTPDLIPAMPNLRIIGNSFIESTRPSASVTARPLGGALCNTDIVSLAQGSTDAATGGAVSALQTFLAARPAIYPEGLVTGFYGPLSAAAIARWQEGNGIVDDPGIAGPPTLAHIRGVACAASR